MASWNTPQVGFCVILKWTLVLRLLLWWIKQMLMHHIWCIWCNCSCIGRCTDPNWPFIQNSSLVVWDSTLTIYVKTNKSYVFGSISRFFSHVSLVYSCTHYHSFIFFWGLCTYLFFYMFCSINSSYISKKKLDIVMGINQCINN